MENRGPTPPQGGDAAPDRRARLIFAAIGAALSIALVLIFYVPGMRDDNDLGDMVLLLALPCAALCFPFALLALVLRVKAVWIIAGVLMMFTVAAAGSDLIGGPKEGGSLLWLFFVFLGNLFIVGVALVVDVAVRGAKKIRSSAG